MCLKALDSHGRVQNCAKLYLNSGRLVFSHILRVLALKKKQAVDKSEIKRFGARTVAVGAGAGALPSSPLQKEAETRKEGEAM